MLIDHVLVYKEYATLLFYSSKIREAEQVLMSALSVLKWVEDR